MKNNFVLEPKFIWEKISQIDGLIQFPEFELLLKAYEIKIKELDIKVENLIIDMAEDYKNFQYLGDTAEDIIYENFDIELYNNELCYKISLEIDNVPNLSYNERQELLILEYSNYINKHDWHAGIMQVEGCVGCLDDIAEDEAEIRGLVFDYNKSR